MDIVDSRIMPHRDGRRNGQYPRMRTNESYPWAIDVWRLTDNLDKLSFDLTDHLSDTRVMVYNWVIENVGYEPEVRLGTFYFKDKEDAIAFKMRWG